MHSVSLNKDFNWLFFTNNKNTYSWPSNVTVEYIEFEDLVKVIQSKFDFSIVINRPHKLCDFKPAYGYIFSEYLIDSDFWGYSDIDLIYSHLNTFFPDEFIVNYDKIGVDGHFCLYRNLPKLNVVFKNKIDDIFPYKIVFSNAKSYAFDEYHCPIKSINHLFENSGLRICSNIKCLNFSMYKMNFEETNYSFENNNYSTKSTKGIIVEYKDGLIKKNEIIGQSIVVEDYSYLHLHKRKMTFNCGNETTDFLIIPNEFIPYTNISVNQLKKYSSKPIIDKQFLRIKLINLKAKIREYLS